MESTQYLFIYMYISAQKMKWNTYNCWVVRLNKRLSTLDEHVQKQPEAKWKTKLKKKKQKVKKNKNKDVQQTVHSKLMRYNTLHSSVCVSVRECGFLKITAKKTIDRNEVGFWQFTQCSTAPQFKSCVCYNSSTTIILIE